MKPLVRVGALLALLAFTLPSPAVAQGAFLFGGGGVTFGTGDFGDDTDAGWLAIAGVGTDIGTSGVFIAAEGFYGSNSLSDDALDESANVYGAFGEIGYGFQTGGNVEPYVLGGAGILVLDVFDESESGLGYLGAAGLSISTDGPVGFWIEGRFMAAPGLGEETATTSEVDVTMFGIVAGIGIGLGG